MRAPKPLGDARSCDRALNALALGQGTLACIDGYILIYISRSRTIRSIIGGALSVSKRPKPPSKRKLLELPADLALDLEAFCEAHYGAAAAEILRQALRRFIDSELKGELKLRDRFLEARRRLGDSKSRGIRLIHADKPS